LSTNAGLFAIFEIHFFTQDQYAFVHLLILEHAELPDTDRTVDSLKLFTNEKM